MVEFIIQYWVEFLFSIIISGMALVIKKLNKKLNEQEAIKMGVQALLRDRIIQTYNIYCDKGYCPIFARENIQELAKQYFNLGGNGVIHDLLDKIKELPTEPTVSGDGNGLQ